MAGLFKILAVDGGGIRGIIPALVLAAIEERTQRPICASFDLIAGTSTGGIIALGLTKPGEDGQVEKSASDLVRLYEEEGGTIFAHNLWQELHLDAVRGAKYDPHGLETTLQKYFGERRLKEALKPVLIPSYDIEKQTPIFFKSLKAQADPASDFAMRDVARSTSAAPTYFPPKKIPTTDPLDYYALVDGGVVAGNPALCAYAEAIRMLRATNGDPNSIMLVSLGTGELRHPLNYDDAVNWGLLGWAQPIFDIVLQGSNDTVNYQLQQLLQPEGTARTYYRFQLELSQEIAQIDDASPANLKHLMDATRDYVGHADTRADLDELCQRLVS
jgi:patatin-like phospholipase/acyl hydrolase